MCLCCQQSKTPNDSPTRTELNSTQLRGQQQPFLCRKQTCDFHYFCRRTDAEKKAKNEKWPFYF